MKQDRISGGAIILGSLMAVATMALHPVGGRPSTDMDYLTRVVDVAFAVHALALVAIAVQAFGFLGFHRALGSGGARARAGLVAFVVAWIAVFGAALAGGILTSAIIRLYPDLDAAGQSAMDAIWLYNFMVNQALDKVWIIGTCVGTLSWSLLTWSLDRPWKITSAVGIAVSTLALLALATGQLRMNVTGVGLFVAGFSLWTVAVGALLCRRPATG